MRRAHAMPFGAAVTDDGVRFRMWAPTVSNIALEVGGQRVAMSALENGWHEAMSRDARPGSRYRYCVDDELFIPDPASRFNPDDVHGASVVIDPRAFEWTDDDWRGRPWHEAVIYELHVGTFSPEGTFAGVEKRLDYLVDLGVTAIELMPLADFPGKWNWGYDGVLPFAPDATYGAPDALKSLVAAAHARGLMVLIDVVYNHFGPEGNYLHRIASPFFTKRHHTPWGAAIDFRGREVREFFIHNALYWLDEFHADGLRLDAVHAIFDDSSPDFLTELAYRVRDGPGRERHVHLVLENDRNAARRLARDGEGRPVTFTAQWNDDFHHAAHVLLTNERHGYYEDFSETPLALLGRCLAQGFAYQGEPSRHRRNAPRGELSAGLPPVAFVNFLQNHDQVGNRALGDRLHALASPDALRTMLEVLLLAPSIPMLFMGEEFAAASPFLYFCDFEPALANAVRDGRREEFAHSAGDIADPCAEATFAKSRLDWSHLDRDLHAHYRDLIAERRARIVPLLPHIDAGKATYVATDDTLGIRWPLDDGRILRMSLRLRPEWQVSYTVEHE